MPAAQRIIRNPFAENGVRINPRGVRFRLLPDPVSSRHTQEHPRCGAPATRHRSKTRADGVTCRNLQIHHQKNAALPFIMLPITVEPLTKLRQSL